MGNKAYDRDAVVMDTSGSLRVNARRGTRASHSVFLENAANDTRHPSSNASQHYGYAEQNTELTDIKQLGHLQP